MEVVGERLMDTKCDHTTKGRRLVPRTYPPLFVNGEERERVESSGRYFFCKFRLIVLCSAQIQELISFVERERERMEA